jgi:hypothetical protein
MENGKRNNMLLDLVEYASSLTVVGLLFMGLNSYYASGGNSDVLGASDSYMASNITVGGLPLWAALVLGGMLIMGVIVLVTVLLSYSTIKHMKRG